MSSYYYGWRPYVTVAERRRMAERNLKKLHKKGLDIQPIRIEGRKIARTFWGEAWCGHLEKFSDFSNRLPRGRTYVRNGSVCHLEIKPGTVKAMVSGSEMYHVDVAIARLSETKWRNVKKRCSGHIGSLLELLQGKFSTSVMDVVTNRDKGLFPLPGEIEFQCDCPDWATMCKHVAAVLYGVGARLDEEPELLFLLRGVNHEDLISAEADMVAATTGKRKGSRHLAKGDLSDVFGIDMYTEEGADHAKPSRVEAKAGASSKRKRRKKGTPKASSSKRAGKSTGKKSTQKTRRQSNAIPTARAVIQLRRKFGLPRQKFAQLLGISVATVSNWEKSQGRLHLQARTLAAWNEAARLTTNQARKRLNAV